MGFKFPTFAGPLALVEQTLARSAPLTHVWWRLGKVEEGLC